MVTGVQMAVSVSSLLLGGASAQGSLSITPSSIRFEKVEEADLQAGSVLDLFL